MAMPSFAFSVHKFISSTGADAGFAAIIGLAILVLLYFAHARETANLREEAALLTQRLHHAEARVAQLMRLQSAAEAESKAQLPAVALSPFAPAGTAAPALASATHVLPLALEIPEPEQPIVVQRPAAAPVGAMAMAGAGGPALADPPPHAPRAPLPTAEPSPAPAAVPPPATNAGGNGHPTDRPSAPPTSPAAARRPAASRSLPPLDAPRRRGRRSRLGRGIAVALVALAAVAIAVGLFALTSSTGGSASRSPGTQASNAPTAGHTRGATAFKPSSITVAVLNGTSVNQLAHRVGGKLAALGFKEGALATATNQTQSTTIVAYLPGAKNRTGALRVAAALKLPSSAVQPVDQSTLQVACPGPSACTANVVVTVGSDLSTL